MCLFCIFVHGALLVIPNCKQNTLELGVLGKNTRTCWIFSHYRLFFYFPQCLFHHHFIVIVLIPGNFSFSDCLPPTFPHFPSSLSLTVLSLLLSRPPFFHLLFNCSPFVQLVPPFLCACTICSISVHL